MPRALIENLLSLFEYLSQGRPFRVMTFLARDGLGLTVGLTVD